MSLKLSNRPFFTHKEFVRAEIYVHSDNVKVSFGVLTIPFCKTSRKVDAREVLTIQLPAHPPQPKAFTKQ